MILTKVHCFYTFPSGSRSISSDTKCHYHPMSNIKYIYGGYIFIFLPEMVLKKSCNACLYGILPFLYCRLSTLYGIPVYNIMYLWDFERDTAMSRFLYGFVSNGKIMIKYIISCIQHTRIKSINFQQTKSLQQSEHKYFRC